VAIRAEFYVFRPGIVRVPAGRPVTFRITSPDVLHGFQIVGTNVNLTVAPGYVSQVTTTFARPGEYLVVCNEYCGLAHHLMQGKIVVEGPR
jgi:cytochrome c oxidase subunit 2